MFCGSMYMLLLFVVLQFANTVTPIEMGNRFMELLSSFHNVGNYDFFFFDISQFFI